MTPEEYAARVMGETKYAGVRYPDDGNGMRDAVARAVREAVAAERERCAKVAESFGESGNIRTDYVAEDIAERIRAGG
jgi:hypothetical protein